LAIALYNQIIIQNNGCTTELGTDLQSLALNGSALEFTYQRFNIARKKIKQDDVIVIALTDFDRRWFFKNYPQFAEQDCSPTDNKKENKAIKLFRRHLDHKEIHHTYLIDFLYNLESLVDEIRAHVIILPNFADVENFFKDKKDLFPLLNIANGKLDNIADKSIDANLNHLSNDAHTRLAQQIINNVRNKESITL